MAKKSTLWIKAARNENGVRNSVMLVDVKTPSLDGEDILRVDISQDMAEKEIPIEVPDCVFVQSYITQGIIEEYKNAGAKKAFTEYRIQREKDIKNAKEGKEVEIVLSPEVVNVAAKALQKELAKRVK